MKEEESGAKGPGRTAGYGLYILPLESFLMISQVEMIGYIAQQIPPTVSFLQFLSPSIPLLDHLPHFFWIHWEWILRAEPACLCMYARLPACLSWQQSHSCHPVLLPGKETDGRPKALKKPSKHWCLDETMKNSCSCFRLLPSPIIMTKWKNGIMEVV